MSAAEQSTVLLIEGCDFDRSPVGGQLTTAKQLLSHFGPRFALVGLSRDDTEVGRWIKRTINGHEFSYFGIGTNLAGRRKPLIPARLATFLQLRRYRRQILSLGSRAAYVLAPEVMLAIKDWGLSVAYSFCGVENALQMARYPLARHFSARFEKILFTALATRTELLVAAADRESVKSMCRRSLGLLTEDRIAFLPSMVDTNTFRLNRTPGDLHRPLVVCCGRLNRAKGWDLILSAFRHFRRDVPQARLVFIGDGEDRSKLESSIRHMNAHEAVGITGFLEPEQVAAILNCANLFVLGSHREGWPTAMIEAEVCGLPVVSTMVSGVEDLIAQGENGYVVARRNAEEFAANMKAALKLDLPNPVSIRIGSRYSVERQMTILERAWRPLQRRTSPCPHDLQAE
jgi:glycosyltransferase involved in cell wall biosynthesis